MERGEGREAGLVPMTRGLRPPRPHKTPGLAGVFFSRTPAARLSTPATLRLPPHPDAGSGKGASKPPHWEAVCTPCTTEVALFCRTAPPAPALGSQPA